MSRRKLTIEEKEAKKIAKEKEHVISQLANELKDLRHRFINEPTVIYKVGDKVRRGAIKESYVTEVLDNGKILKLHEIVTNNNYGNPKDYERDAYTEWHNVQIDREDTDTVLMKEDLVQFQTYQQTISSVILRYYHFGINMSPDYQRGNVWDLEDKVSLIESILNNVEIGKFTFIKLPYKENSPNYEVLDGKQRITALIEFYEGRFAYKGFKYREMSFCDQIHIREYNISVSETSPITDAQKYEYFLKLNTTGKEQDKEHIEFVKGLLKK